MTNLQKTVRTLEFDRILALVGDCCELESGKERLLSLMPSSDPAWVKRQLQYTTDAKNLLANGKKPALYTHVGVPDMLSRLEKGAVLTPGELLRLARLLASARSVASAGQGGGVSLGVLFARLLPNPSLEEQIHACIASEEQIADDASPQLASIRRQIVSCHQQIRETLQKYITGSMGSFLQENIITTRNGRFVIPVKVEYKNAVKGMIHDTSASGSTVFIEPASVVELNNKIRLLENEQAREEERILNALSRQCEAFGDALALNHENITTLSVIFAKAEYSWRTRSVCPGLEDGHRFRFIKARHPLVDPAKVVPIDISLGFEFDSLVITGPNTGGKTVSIKTAGLLSMMLQAGLHIPVEEGSVGCVFGEILADIGDEQSIEQSLSTFSSHMVTIVDMIERASSGTLCLFDELGAGTDPVEGAALAVSILEHVRQKGAKILATTHYAELKTYALQTQRVENASCEFDVNTLRPTYRLIIGTPGRSNAFLIAQRLGLSAGIIQDASGQIDSDRLQFEAVVAKLEADRLEMETQLEQARRQQEQTQRLQQEALAERDKLLAFAEKEVERAKKEAARLVMSAKQVSDTVFGQLQELQRKSQRELMEQDLQTKRQELREQLRGVDRSVDSLQVREETDEDYVLPRPLQPGDRVLLANTQKEGVVESVTGKDALVLVGSIRTKIKISRLRLITQLQKGKSTGKGLRRTSSSARNVIQASVDLRGELVDDALLILDKYIDDAVLANLNQITVIHGKGTGALRKAVTQFLKKDKRIHTSRPGVFGEGDSGVTVAQLKE